MNIGVYQSKGLNPRIDGSRESKNGEEFYRVLFREQFNKDAGYNTISIFVDEKQLRGMYEQIASLIDASQGANPGEA